MKRWEKAASFLTIAAVVWFACLFGVIPLSPYSKDVAKAAPLWAIIAFASYSCFVIGFNMFTFRDSPPSALAEVEKDVAEARAQLKKKGFTFD